MEKAIKIKIALGALGGIVVTAILGFVVISQEGDMPKIKGINFGTSSEYSSNDSDKDGLSDSLESIYLTDLSNPDTDGDGYLDGEEVASGCDPKTAGPKDCASQQKNLTDKAANLLLGGYLSGDLNPKSANINDSIKTITTSLVEDVEKSTPKYKPLISDDNSPEAIKRYAENLKRVLEEKVANGLNNITIEKYANKKEQENFLNDLVNQDPTQISLSLESANLMKAGIDELLKIETPSMLKKTQEDIINLISEFESIFRSWSNFKDDPLKAFINLERYLGALSEFSTIIQEFVNTLQSPS